MSEARNGRTRAGDVADHLRGQILSGELTAGDKLPTEGELRAAFDVSRSVVREALQQLQASGLVESFQGRGSYVLELPEVSADTSFRAVTREDAAALLEYRMGVECEAAALAAMRRSELQLKAIERALDRFMSASVRPQDLIPADFDLHLKIALASGNRFCREALMHLGVRMIMSQRAALPEGVDVANQGHFDRVCAEHEAIVVAIRSGDPQTASAAMRLHLAGSKRRLRR